MLRPPALRSLLWVLVLALVALVPLVVPLSHSSAPRAASSAVPRASSSAGLQRNVVPEVATGEPQPTATASSAAVVNSDPGLVQGSRHRYGLPAALAVVALAGVASLLGRLLLAQQVARRPRADGGWTRLDAADGG